METYILEDDEVGRRFADALLEKQRQGVQVNLIYDAVGAMATPGKFFERLTDAGIRVVKFNPVNPLEAKRGWDVNNRDHRKLLIVDGTTAFVGGINISAVYSGSSGHGRFGSSGAVRGRGRGHGPALARHPCAGERARRRDPAAVLRRHVDEPARRATRRPRLLSASARPGHRGHPGHR
jgi:phosphatidylserine/phosphatidylglycerophosphate/cardiolipin synthase-like enzyme